MNHGTRGLSLLLAVILALTLAAPAAASEAGATVAFPEGRPQLNPEVEVLPDQSDVPEQTGELESTKEISTEQSEAPEAEHAPEPTEAPTLGPATPPTVAPAEQTPSNYTAPALVVLALALCAGVIFVLRKKKKNQSKL